MKQNVGSLDRMVRIVGGLAILALFFLFDEPLRWWALFGLVPLGTGLLGWCPAYLPFGFSSCQRQ